ncbi:hypothetical protein NFI96_004691 [Prochilodus magdalenae]|nr:hypothetical protein NFI96_004691 [Prochilodus magdalenae]
MGGMKTITGYMQRTDSATDGDEDRANEFNTFYNRFDCPVQVSAASADTSSTLPLASAPDTSVSDCLDINTPPSSFVIHAPLPQADSSDNTAPALPFSHLLSPDLTCSTTEAHTSPLLHTFTADQVRGELRRLHTRKAAGPDRVCPRLLKSCAAELGAPLQHIFNLSLCLGRVPTLWRTSCLVPVPKKGRPSELNDFRPVALTSHVMKTLERLLLHLLRPQVQHAMDPLQFAYREKVGRE